MLKKFVSYGLSLLMAVSVIASNPFQIQAEQTASAKSADLQGVSEVKVDSKQDNIVWITFNNGMKGKVTFLDNNIFRYNVDPTGKFSEYAKVRDGYPDTAKIQQYPDSSKNYLHPSASVQQLGTSYKIKAGDVTITFDEQAKMSIQAKDKVVMSEKESLKVSSTTIQTLNKNDNVSEQFFGGGTQNGRMIHTNNVINISNESGWNDGQVSSPNPFYYTSNGYGVLRNTYASGNYDFGAKDKSSVVTKHSEDEFDAYYFVSDKTDTRSVVQELLNGYFKVTGNPVLLPEYAFYLGHLNAYNRDAWSHENIGKAWEIKGNGPYDQAGTTTYERGGTGTELKAGETAETLNGYGPSVSTQLVPEGVLYSQEFSARGVLNQYVEHDMPFGFFLPNDGYGAGYGQNGFKVTGGVDSNGKSSPERLAAVAANVANLKDFATYAQSNGVATGLWTQSQLVPDSNPKTEWQLLRDFENEVRAGVTTLKTDVAWVGPGYSFQLSGVKQAYDIVTTVAYDDDRAHTRPNIISLDGWAGSQRYNSVWTGDQAGGNWDYIRFHIPTFIGQGLAGNPNIGTDMDGIWGGAPVIATRDYQWKSFAPQMLDMDGWGTYAKKPFTHGDPYTGVSRMYLKMKARMMPYTYTNAYAAANMDTGNNDKGLPMVRAMFLEYPNDPMAYSDLVNYQYMYGENLLVAPIYQDTDQDEDVMNDIRDGIYLPDANQIWIDYFTGEQYRGGKFIDNFDAPLWKLPLFVKNGAILPMFEENNSAYKVDRTKRFVEFWPEGSSDFTAIEDDGTYIENKTDDSNKEYGVIDNVSYGPHVSTKYTSVVKDGVATLTANKATGSYNGYDANKETTFIVNVSKQPTSLVAKNGATTLSEVAVDSKEAFDAAKVDAGTYVMFYDAHPEIETYASAEETNLANMVKNVKVSPKLYVKFAETDSQANAQTLVINGFENDGKLNKDTLNKELEAPKNVKELEDLKTPTSITLGWDLNEEANEYQILVDGTFDEQGNVESGMLHSVPRGCASFTNTNLKFLSKHSYYVRSVNAKGHSAWSPKVEATSADDPYCDTPEPNKITWSGDIWGSHTGELAFDKIFQTGDGGFHSNHGGVNETLTVDYGYAYLFDYIEFYPRTDAGNGTPEDMIVETSLDGVHWLQHGNKMDAKGNKYYHCTPDATMKVIDLSDPFKTDNQKQYIGARYIRFTPTKTVGTFFSASEIKPYVAKGATTIGGKEKPWRVGNLYTQGTGKPSLDDFKTVYLKDSSAHKNASSPQWVGEVRDTYADINYNNISDIWDYTYNGFNVDGSELANYPIQGSIEWVPSAKTIQKGDTFTIAFQSHKAKNVSAFGAIININPEKVQYVNTTYCSDGLFTDGLTKVITSEDGRTYINHNALFMGNKLIVGNGVADFPLSTITLKALDTITLNDVTDPDDPNFIIDLTNGMMIAPDHSFVEVDKNASQNPIQQLGRNDFNLTLTNPKLTKDDGKNIDKLIQNPSYDVLFNGAKGDGAREFELKWQTTEETVLPLTLHMEVKDPKYIHEVKAYNANKANGYVTSAKAQVTYTDGTTSDEVTINKASAVYDFKFDANKKVKNIDVTFLTAVNASNEVVNNMLTISEIEVFGTEKASASLGKLGLSDVTPTMTNDHLKSDDGSNVSKLIQQNNYDGLFDGNKGDNGSYRDFEFKWNIPQNHVDGSLPAYIALPTTIHFALQTPKYVSNVKVYNANKGNGYLTSAKAQVTYTDGTKSDEITISKEKPVYSFDFNTDKQVSNIDITFLSATGSQMLTLSEIEIFGSDEKEVQKEVVNKDNLEKAIFNAKGFNFANYTQESVEAVTMAVKEAQSVLDDQGATQESVDYVLDYLVRAVNALEYKGADYSKVDAAIEKANSLVKGDYLDFSKVDAAINAVVRGKNITEQAQVDAMATAINVQISKLVKFTIVPVEMNATLRNNIDMNIFFSISETIAKDQGAYIELSVENGQQSRKYFIKDLAKQENGTYKATLSLYARQMSDVVTVQIYTTKEDGRVSADQAYTYSILGYAKQVLNTPDVPEKAVNLVHAMLDYGAMAQNYFNYKPNQLINEQLTHLGFKEVIAENFDMFKPVFENETAVDGIRYGATNLRLLSDVAIRHHFKVNEDFINRYEAGTIRFEYVDPETEEAFVVTPTFNKDKAYVEIPKVYAINFDAPYILRVIDTENNTTMSIEYSVLSYGYEAFHSEKASEKLKDLVKAMYQYNYYARQYIAR